MEHAVDAVSNQVVKGVAVHPVYVAAVHRLCCERKNGEFSASGGCNKILKSSSVDFHGQRNVII
jgi:hypothetical protein